MRRIIALTRPIIARASSCSALRSLATAPLRSSTVIGWVQQGTEATSLAGGRFVAQAGDFVEVSLHAVSAHQTTSVTDELVETLHKASLTNEQN